MDPRVNVFYWSLFAPDPDAAIIEGRSQEHFQNSHNLIINPQILKFSLFNNKSGAESQISQQSDFHENYEDSKKSNRAFFVAAWFSSRLLNFFFGGRYELGQKTRNFCQFVPTRCLIWYSFFNRSQLSALFRDTVMDLSQLDRYLISDLFFNSVPSFRYFCLFVPTRSAQTVIWEALVNKSQLGAWFKMR